MLSLLLFSPLAGALVLALAPSEPLRSVRRLALALAVLPLLLSVLVLLAFAPGEAGFQLEERAAWLPAWGVSYHLGIDGVSLFLVLLTTVLTPITILAAWEDVRRWPKAFYALLLVLETAMLGALLALDLFLFYVFWEVMLVPMYFLIGIWGGARRVYAAVKFVLFTMAGSLPLLIAVIYCAWKVRAATGVPDFGYEAVLALSFTPAEQIWLFAAFAFAFAIKVPVFPLHTWLPDAHVEAPTAGSVILAGVLLKMGTYGFLRFAIPFFPGAVVVCAPLFVALAVVGIVYGALVAVMQADMKKLVAYSSVSHLGFVMLGLFALTPTAVVGSVYQMLNHGLSTGGLFLLVGMLYERRHTRALADFGGLWAAVPHYSVALLLMVLASVGLPGLNGFVGEFLILVGAFETWPWATAVATSGLVLGAVYLLWLYQRVVFGPLDRDENRQLADLSGRERLVLAPVIALCLLMGLYPRPFLERIQPSVERMLARVELPVPAALALRSEGEDGR
jgi:NADH-quinone oxidoreductase subunit M